MEVIDMANVNVHEPVVTKKSLPEALRAAVKDTGSQWRALLSEFFGTAFFIYLATATSLNSMVNGSSPDGVLRGALVAGGALTLMIFATGHISGGHLNPAVTLAIMVSGKISVLTGIMYWVAQLCGSMVAGGFFYQNLGPLVNKVTAEGLGLVPIVPEGTAMIVQMIVSALLYWTVLATAVNSKSGDARNSLAPLAIGMSVVIGGIVAGPIIGASQNPAGVFGNMVAFNIWGSWWIYLFGPLASAGIVGFVYRLAKKSETCK